MKETAFQRKRILLGINEHVFVQRLKNKRVLFGDLEGL